MSAAHNDRYRRLRHARDKLGDGKSRLNVSPHRIQYDKKALNLLRLLNADKKRIENNGGNDAIVGNSALCFDTYNVICDAIEAGNTIDGEALKDAISKIDGDYVTGHITFNETGDANKDSAYIDIAKDGKFQFLKIVTVGGGESSTEAATEAE